MNSKNNKKNSSLWQIKSKQIIYFTSNRSIDRLHIDTNQFKEAIDTTDAYVFSDNHSDGNINEINEIQKDERSM